MAMTYQQQYVLDGSVGRDFEHFILIFDNGHFSEYGTFSITDWMALTSPQVLAQNFNFARLAVDPNFIQQGYYTADPYYVVRQGVKLKYLYCWDTGFDSYATIVTNRTFAREHGPALRAFLRALHHGWQHYLEQDPGPAHAIMLRINPKVTPDYLAWSRGQIIAAHLARTADADYLTITPARYLRQISQLEDLGVLPPHSLRPEDVMDASFLPSP